MRRSAAERLQAWLVTGPAGHLWSAAVDVVVLWWRYALRSAQRMLAGVGRRPSRRR